jgi:hypothetical protein
VNNILLNLKKVKSKNETGMSTSMQKFRIDEKTTFSEVKIEACKFFV